MKYPIKLLQQVAGAFLNKQLPENWNSMKTDEQAMFVKEHRYYAAEALSVDATIALITNGARKLSMDDGHYFLYGSAAVSAFENGGADEVIENCLDDCSIEHFDTERTIEQVLYSMVCWSDYTRITEDEYNSISAAMANYFKAA